LANGKPPYCMTCKHFELRLRDGESCAEVIRSRPNRGACRLHNVFLPLNESDALLVCVDWQNYKTEDGFNSVVRNKLKDNMLYSYQSEYDREPWVPYATFATLGSAGET
jgi:hypothetical protein